MEHSFITFTSCELAAEYHESGGSLTGTSSCHLHPSNTYAFRLQRCQFPHPPLLYTHQLSLFINMQPKRQIRLPPFHPPLSPHINYHARCTPRVNAVLNKSQHISHIVRPHRRTEIIIDIVNDVYVVLVRRVICLVPRWQLGHPLRQRGGDPGFF